MQIKTDFYNNAQSELDAKYFPNVKYYRDNENCAKLHYQTELFNNGCLAYDKYINTVAKLCKDTGDNIKEIVNRHIKF
jgi:hypothetical protein